MQRSHAVPGIGALNEFGMFLQKCYEGRLVLALKRQRDFRRQSCIHGLRYSRLTALLFLADSGHDFFVAAFHCERQWPGGLAMGMNTSTRIRSMLHQQAYNLGVPLQHSVMQSAMLIGT